MPFFTKENASDYARLGNIARWHTPKSLPDPTQQTAITEANCDTVTIEVSKRLKRVRRQLDMVDSRIEEEASKQGGIDRDGKVLPACDGQLLNWLCSAQERLAEQERILANRPLPGTLKPTQPKQPKHTQLPPAPDVPPSS